MDGPKPWVVFQTDCLIYKQNTAFGQVYFFNPGNFRDTFNLKPRASIHICIFVSKYCKCCLQWICKHLRYPILNFAIFVLDIFTTNSKSIEVTESLKGYEHFSSSHFEYVWNSSFIWREHIWCEVQLQNVQGKHCSLRLFTHVFLVEYFQNEVYGWTHGRQGKWRYG